MSLLQETAKQFALIKAGKKVKELLDQVGIDTIRTLVEKDISIAETYLSGASEYEKAVFRENLVQMVKFGITPEMLWEEVTRQIPELGNIIDHKDAYVQREIKALEEFVTTG